MRMQHWWKHDDIVMVAESHDMQNNSAQAEFQHLVQEYVCMFGGPAQGPTKGRNTLHVDGLPMLHAT